MGDVLDRLIVKGEDWKDVLSDLLRQGASNFLRAAGSALFGGAPTGSPLGFLGQLFGGFRAEGGPLSPGKWYVAGERGPEPVWGGGAGAFAVPTAAAMGGGAGNLSVVYNIDASGADPAAIARLETALASNTQAIASVHKSTGPRAMAYLAKYQEEH